MTPPDSQNAATSVSEPAAPPDLIETMRLEPDATLPLLTFHLERLRHSSAALGYPCPREDDTRQHIKQAVANLETGHWWRLRLLLSADGSLTVETAPLAPPAAVLKVVVQGPRLSGAERWLRHKTTYRPWYAAAARWLAEHPDIFDVLYWNENGEMCEGSRSNLYMQAPDGRWLTPPLEAGVLPGAQRQALLDRGQAQVAVVSRDDFLQAQNIRISNGLRGWCDVTLSGD